MNEEGLSALATAADIDGNNRIDYEEFMSHFKTTIKILKTQIVLNSISPAGTTCCTPKSEVNTTRTFTKE